MLGTMLRNARAMSQRKPQRQPKASRQPEPKRCSRDRKAAAARDAVIAQLISEIRAAGLPLRNPEALL